MKNRPIVIIAIACVQFAMPFVSFFYNSLILNVSLKDYWGLLLTNYSNSELALMVLPFVLAGFAILAMKTWSYFLFMGVTLWIVGINFFLWYVDRSITDSFLLVLLANFFNIGLVSYFLLPKIQLIYFNQRVRWWESQPRFETAFEATACETKGEISSTTVIVRDLSEGGLYFELSSQNENGFSTDQSVIVTFEILSKVFTIPGTIVHTKKLSEEKSGYGLQVTGDRQTKRRIKDLAYALILLGYQPKVRPDSLSLSLKLWWRQVRDGDQRAWAPEPLNTPTHDNEKKTEPKAS